MSTIKCHAVAHIVAVCAGPWGRADRPWGPVSVWWPTLSDEMAESCVNGAGHHGSKPAQQSSHSSRAYLLRVRQLPVSKPTPAELLELPLLLTHPLTPSLTRFRPHFTRVAHSFTDALMHALTDGHTPSVTQTVTHFISHFLTHSLAHSLTNSLTHSFTHSRTHPLTH